MLPGMNCANKSGKLSGGRYEEEKNVNQREKKKRTVKAETVAKTVPTAKEIKTEKTVSAVKEKKAVKPDTQGIFDNRMARKIDELRWLYMELYGNGSMFAE